MGDSVRHSSIANLNYQVLFESVPGLYLVLTPDYTFTIVAASDAYLQATMTQRAEILGRGIFEVFPDNPNDPAATGVQNLRCSLEAVLQNRQSDVMAVQKYDIPRPISQGNGFEERYWSAVNSPVFGTDQAIIYIVHRVEDVTDFVRLKQQRNEQYQQNQALRDRTEQMEAEIYQRAQELNQVNRQLQAANEALVELDRAKTVFFGNISHEFRTPLTLMLNPIEDMLSDASTSPQQRQQAELVRRNGLRLLKLVNTLLDSSRIEADSLPVTYEPTDLAHFTTELASVFRSAIEQVGLNFIVDCPPLAESVLVDRQMWEKIVLNLLSNAFKFTFEGEIIVELQAVGNCVELTVQDTGVGIPLEELPHLFERFYRVNGTRSRTHEGSGIGLALVQELVKLHNGTIDVSSQVEQGTTFTVKIPLIHPQAVPVSTSLSPSSAIAPEAYITEAIRWLPDQNPELNPELATQNSLRETQNQPARILLIDDNADMRQYIQRLLCQHYEVEAVSDGMAAMTAIAQQLPDLVLTDVMMPEVDGIELLRQLRAHPRTASLPIVVLSARAGEEAYLEGLAAGADDYLSKPFSARELLARIRSTLQLAQVRASAAAALSQSEKRYRMLADAIPQLVWMSTAAGQVTYINQRWQEYTGIPSQQSTELNWLDLVHPEDLPRVVTTQTQGIESGKTYEMEYRIKRFDCTYRWHITRVVPFKDAQNQLLYWFGTATDIHDIKQIEAGQKFLGEASSYLAASLDEKVILVNIAKLAVPFLADFCFFDVVNGDQIQRVAWQHKDPAKKQWFDRVNYYIPPQKFFSHPVTSVLTSGKSYLVQLVSDDWIQAIATSAEHLQFMRDCEMRSLITVPLIVHNRKLGTLTFCLTTASNRHYNDVDLRLAQELAHRTALALDRAQLYAQAQEANRTKDQFLAVLSHELRSPLNPILGWSKLLLTSKQDEATLIRGLETIERNVKLQAQLVEDLLDVSNILQGKLSLNVGLVDLKTAIAAAIENVRLAAEAKSIKLQTIFAPKVSKISGDPSRLQQVVWNLLSNAIKFTPSGGQVKIRLEQIDSHVQIQVSDTGIGIEPEFLPYIFDYFRQADSSTTRRFGGLGLGLAIVRHLVALHGGTVQATSLGAGQGASFIVRLPVLNGNKQDTSFNVNTPPLQLEGIKVLVVDDEMDNRELIAIILEQAGANVVTAASAEKALQVLSRKNFDAILCDIEMPNIDGYTLLRQIKSQGKQITAIALTAYAGTINQQQASSAGFGQHLAKPIDPTTLVNAIINAVKR